MEFFTEHAIAIIFIVIMLSNMVSGHEIYHIKDWQLVFKEDLGDFYDKSESLSNSLAYTRQDIENLEDSVLSMKSKVDSVHERSVELELDNKKLFKHIAFLNRQIKNQQGN